MDEAGKKDTVLQNTNEGYVETPVEEIPLSDATGEGRLRGETTEDEDATGG